MSKMLKVGVLLLVGGLLFCSSSALAATWNTGDLFVAVSGGCYNVYTNAGVFKEQICDGLGGFTTGCAFNPALDKLYTTNFSNTKVVVYDNADPHPILQTVDTGVTSPGGNSESVVFATNGDFYVGHAGGNRLLHKYNASGTLITTFAPATEIVGTDWNDLAANQTTLFYTSEGSHVKRFDTVAGQLSDFNALALPARAFALRLLAPGDGSGGLFVADSGSVQRLDGSVRSDVVGAGGLFSLNLDPNGTSYWVGDFGTSDIFKVTIATGAVETSFNTGTATSTVFGICLKGELTAGGGGGGGGVGRMTGGGSISGSTVRHGFQLHCKASTLPNNLEVNWGKTNKFHLETL